MAVNSAWRSICGWAGKGRKAPWGAPRGRGQGTLGQGAPGQGASKRAGRPGAGLAAQTGSRARFQLRSGASPQNPTQKSIIFQLLVARKPPQNATFRQKNTLQRDKNLENRRLSYVFLSGLHRLSRKMLLSGKKIPSKGIKT